MYFANENDGYPVRGLISIVLSNIFCVKMEHDLVSPLKRKLFKRYVNDFSSKHVENQTDELFTKLINNHHPNIKISIVVT